MYKLAVIGDREQVLAFKSAGVEVFEAKTAQDAESVIKKIASECLVIFITENLFAQIPNTVEKYKESAYPIITPIPSSGGSLGIGLKNIKKNIEKAIGTDVVE